jgi:hypothetical protein
MREDLRKRIEREADRRGVSLNTEMVDRLNDSFTVQLQLLECQSDLRKTTDALIERATAAATQEEYFTQMRKLIDKLSGVLNKT